MNLQLVNLMLGYLQIDAGGFAAPTPEQHIARQ